MPPFAPKTKIVREMMTLRRTKGASRSSEVAGLYSARIDRQEERCFRIADEYVLALEAADFEVVASTGRSIEVKSSGRKVGYIRFRERLSRKKAPGSPGYLQRTPNVMIEYLITRSEPKHDLIAEIPKAIEEVKTKQRLSRARREQQIEAYASYQAERFLEAKREAAQQRIESTLKAFLQMSIQLEGVKRARELLAQLEPAAGDADALTIELLRRYVTTADPLRDGPEIALRTLTIMLRGNADN